jgi:protease YdgD
VTPARLLAGLLALLLAAGNADAQSGSTRLKGMSSANDALVWQAVGRLDAHKTGFCTATLIAPNFILTAAHCVYAPDTHAPLRPEDLTFRAGLRQGIAAAERGIAQIEPHPGFIPNGDMTLDNIRHDVALLRLDAPIPTAELDPFLIAETSQSRGPVSVVSYGRGREDLPSRQEQCQLLAAQQGIVMMNCDATFGSSGAPVFSHLNGRGQIISVISGIGTYDGRRVTYGMSLPNVVEDLKRQMRANAAKPVAEARRVTVGTNRMGGASGSAKFVRP